MHFGPCPSRACACCQSRFTSTAHQFTTRSAVPSPPVARSRSLTFRFLLDGVEYGQVRHAFWKRTVAPDRPEGHVGRAGAVLVCGSITVHKSLGRNSPAGPNIRASGPTKSALRMAFAWYMEGKRLANDEYGPLRPPVAAPPGRRLAATGGAWHIMTRNGTARVGGVGGVRRRKEPRDHALNTSRGPASWHQDHSKMLLPSAILCHFWANIGPWRFEVSAFVFCFPNDWRSAKPFDASPPPDIGGLRGDVMRSDASRRSGRTKTLSISSHQYPGTVRD